MKNILLSLLTLIPTLSFAQSNKQNIRGVVLDKYSQTPIVGAVVQMTVQGQIKAVLTDEKGQYTLADIVPDRYEIKVSFIGYSNLSIPNVVVASGKEIILDVTMEEILKQLDEVVVNSNSKENANNEFATLSARTFSMEEVNRYAGGRSDPARLAANFAGVSAPDDSRNDIVVRGNSPIGVLWRIEGMNVTNPNHFATVGNTGGAVSAINTNMLKNSDFFTGAFPAEYGNANAAVFDLGFRNGNSQKREHLAQFGLITGIEAMTEGPIKKGNGSSYLVGYRYSAAGIAQAMGIDIGTTSLPTYQDLAFKVNSGDTKLGKFTLFGILANSNILQESTKPSSGSKSLYSTGDNVYLASKIGVIGLKHTIPINQKSFINSSIGLNYANTYQNNYQYDTTNTKVETQDMTVTKSSLNFMSSYNAKINSRLFVKIGAQAELFDLYLNYKTKQNTPDWYQVWDYNGYTTLAQAFAQGKYSFTERLVLNAGLHAQYFFLNNSFALEPRLGLKYALTSKSSLSFAYGLHSQLQPINFYFYQTKNADGSTSYTNKNLNFTRSHHFVLGYDFLPFDHWRVKSEIYYQSIFDAPINTYSSTYSLLNTGATFQPDLTDSLTNGGTGRNYGIELTVEKFFSQGYYALFTSSIYDSKYTASDGKERNTAFNGNYVYNILGGKEFKVGKDKRNKISIDLKITNAGGKRYTPYDLEASEATRRGVLKGDDYVYSSQFSSYFRMDFKVGFVYNSKFHKVSQSFSFDIQNITNNKNILNQSYDPRSNSMSYTYQLGIFPNFVYKLQF